MATGKGCLKNTLFGCLGLVAIGILISGITAVVAWRGVGQKQVEDRELAAPAVAGIADTRLHPGRVILDLAQGEFEIRPARPGQDVTVEARYDLAAYALVDSFETLPDSTWVYRVGFRRTIPGLQAIFRALFGGDDDTYVHVYLPPDVPLELVVLVQEGGFEADLGGLWLTDVEIRSEKGGFALRIDEPLREPLERLSIQGQMGGFQAIRLGNASPRSLEVDWQMGGADIDLDGDWARDCDIRLAVRMGGMSVRVPDEVEVEGIEASGRRLRRDDAEVPTPVLRFSVSQSMGEVEVYRR